jgi:hypothetical protein
MYDEDEDELSLVVRLVWQVLRQSPFPPPEPHDSWTEQAVADQVVALYIAKGGAVVAEAVAAAGGDQGHLERRLLQTIRHYLIDAAKSTPVGLMRNRLKSMLTRDDAYVRLEDGAHPLAGWAPAGSEGATGRLWQGDEDALHRAATHTPVPADIVFNKSGPPPAATKRALQDVIAAVFTAAAGSYLPDQLLARVVARRFDEFLDPGGRDVSAYTSPADPETIIDLAPVAQTAELDLDRMEAADVADWLWVEFSRDERIVYPLLNIAGDHDGRVASVVMILGCGEAEAGAIIAAIFAKIRNHSPTSDFAAQLLEELNAIYQRENPDGSPGSTA